jgi:hypothetical protein
MKPATRERIINIMALVVVISIGFLVPKAAAQSDKYSKMGPVDQYMMERNAEILLARSAAPDSISSDATILVLGRQGYETAVRGKNGFVCMVERSWMAAFDSPEFWNPKVRGTECLNRQAARSILLIADLRTRMVMAGHPKAEIVSALKAAFDNKQLPDLESGNMVLRMSKSAYLYDAGDHNGPHVMFFTALKDGKDWGAGVSGSQFFRSLLVLIVEGTVPGERATADSCVRSRSCKVVRRNDPTQASRVDATGTPTPEDLRSTPFASCQGACAVR